MMADIGGMEVLRQALIVDPRLRVVMMTGFATIEAAVEAIRLGASDYLTKPFEDIFEICERVVGDAIEQSIRARTGMVPALPRLVVGDEFFEAMVGVTDGMQRLFQMIREVSVSDATVLIQGETGVGKDLVAAAVHRRSRRSAGPFLPLNCAALPADLLESELFGHCRGAFTGADADKQGVFAAADGGTLFLDEIAEIPLGLQAKLLRVLESGEIRRVGDPRPRRVDVRVVAATHRNLDEWASVGRFRQDLFYRLAVVRLMVPALRERTDDIEPLVTHFLRERGARTGHNLSGISDAALDALCAHSWPGNVRELRNVVERAVIFSRGTEIALWDLPEELDTRPVPAAVDDNVLRIFTGSMENFRDAKRRMLERFEQDYVEHLLISTEGNISAAARIAGLDRSNFRRLLKRTESAEGTPLPCVFSS
jgi:DNA-binding NtrC family response regulator